MLSNEFYNEKEAIINPKDLISPIEGFPKKCIGIFSDKIVKMVIEEYNTPIIAKMHACSGDIPVYKINKNGEEYAVFIAPIGGPMIAGAIEEIGAMGSEKFILFGCCGVLDSTINHGNIIVPTGAVRDEGVSYQYIEPSDEIHMEEEDLKALCLALDELNYPYVKGKTWTTDCIYRETRGRMERRKEQGCITVEMEFASALAVCKFRGYKFAQFLFAADNLDSDVWEKRSLGDRGVPGYDIYMNAAFSAADKL